jgi:CHAT domain-containing protein
MVFETWLGMLVADSKQGGGSDDADSLLALSKIRTIEGYTGSELSVAGRSAGTDLLRDQLGQRANPAAGQSAFALNNTINAGLAKLRADLRTHFEFLSDAGLQKYLRSLGNDELLLTYHISPALAQVWVGQKGRVQRRDIANPAGVYQFLQAARQDPANTGIAAFNSKMDELGTRLLAPVADVLTDTIYLAPAGPLLGFPFDALRINGQYMAERHSVVNLLSFPLNTHPRNSLRTGSLQKVFVAGNPGDYSGDYATRFETSAEIRSIADIFIGPGLQIVQGVALLPDEFEGEYFLQSDLVHLSMPGVINLEFPLESGLELSESEYEPGRMVLRPQDIRSQKLAAGLVFLSSTRSTGKPLSGFSSQPGLAADFADAGAHCVIVNFWSDAGRSDEVFIADFYRRLKGSGDIAESLHESRLRFLENGRANDSYDWAGYQVFIP